MIKVLKVFGQLLEIANDLAVGVEKNTENKNNYSKTLHIGNQTFNIDGQIDLSPSSNPNAVIDHESVSMVLGNLISDLIIVETSPIGTPVINYYSFKLNENEYANMTLRFTRVM